MLLWFDILFHQEIWSVLFLFLFVFQATPDINGPGGANLLVNDQNKYKSMFVRARSSLWMLLGFSLVVYMGHLYICGLIVGIQIFMARELFNLRKQANEDRQLPGFRLLNWYVPNILWDIMLELVVKVWISILYWFQ